MGSISNNLPIHNALIRVWKICYINVSEVTKYKYVLLPSVDVETFFSIYKYIFCDRGHNFTETNLEHVLVTHEGTFNVEESEGEY